MEIRKSLLKAEKVLSENGGKRQAQKICTQRKSSKVGKKAEKWRAQKIVLIKLSKSWKMVAKR
jgi:hypothetical protein